MTSSSVRLGSATERPPASWTGLHSARCQHLGPSPCNLSTRSVVERYQHYEIGVRWWRLGPCRHRFANVRARVLLGSSCRIVAGGNKRFFVCLSSTSGGILLAGLLAAPKTGGHPGAFIRCDSVPACTTAQLVSVRVIYLFCARRIMDGDTPRTQSRPDITGSSDDTAWTAAGAEGRQPTSSVQDAPFDLFQGNHEGNTKTSAPFHAYPGPPRHFTPADTGYEDKLLDKRALFRDRIFQDEDWKAHMSHARYFLEPQILYVLPCTCQLFEALGACWAGPPPCRECPAMHTIFAALACGSLALFHFSGSDWCWPLVDNCRHSERLHSYSV